jgi:hypothetical protein
MSDLVLSALIAVGASIVAAAVTLLLLRRRLAGPSAVAAGYVVGHVTIAGARPEFPPVLTEDWLLYFVIPMLVLAVLESRMKREWRWSARAVLCGLGIFLLLKPRLQSWDGLESAAWIGGQALVWLVLWGAFDHAAQRCDRQSREWRPSGVMFLLGLVVVASATSVVLLNSSSAKLAQFAGGLAASLGVCLVFAWWRPSWGLCRGVTAVSTFVLVGLWSEGYHYNDLTRSCGALLVSAGLLGWIGSLEVVERAGRLPTALIRLFLTAAPAVVAVWLTIGGSDDVPGW